MTNNLSSYFSVYISYYQDLKNVAQHTVLTQNLILIMIGCGSFYIQLILKQQSLNYAGFTYMWIFKISLIVLQGFSCGASSKESACWCRRLKDIRLDPWVGKITWARAWQPQHSCLESPRSLMHYRLTKS